jgi:sugar/nucleoside kinase (ribokinase family)
MMENIDILMIGHFAKDELIVDGHSETASGGAVYYGSMALRRLGLNVAIVTRLNPADYPRLEELRQAGIQVIVSPSDQTSGIANYYQSSNMERRICKLKGFAGTFSLEEIPFIPVKVILISGIIAGEVNLALLKELSKRAPLGLDVQGFVRVPEGEDLVFKPWADMIEGLSYITYLKVDQAEAEHLTGEADIQAAARKLAAYGPKEIILTQSSGPTVYAGGQFYQAPFTPRNLSGRTGRGDTCFSTYVGKRLTASPAEATQWAAAVTTLKQEKPGPWQGSIAEVEELLRQRVGTAAPGTA